MNTANPAPHRAAVAVDGISLQNPAGLRRIVLLVQHDQLADFWRIAPDATERDRSGPLRVPGCPCCGVRASRLNRGDAWVVAYVTAANRANSGAENTGRAAGEFQDR